MATNSRWCSKMATIRPPVIIDRLHQKELFISFCLPQVLARKITGWPKMAAEQTGMVRVKVCLRLCIYLSLRNSDLRKICCLLIGGYHRRIKVFRDRVGVGDMIGCIYVGCVVRLGIMGGNGRKESISSDVNMNDSKRMLEKKKRIE